MNVPHIEAARIEAVRNSIHRMYVRFQYTVTDPKKAAALSNTEVRLLTRVEMLPIVVDRVFDAWGKLAEVEREHDASIQRGDAVEGRFFDRMRRTMELRAYVELDLETFFTLGSLIIDDWSFLVWDGLIQAEHGQFQKLIDAAHHPSTKYPQLNPLKDTRLAGLASYLYAAVRVYRNKFVQHSEEPWSLGITFHPGVPGVALDRHLPDILMPDPATVETATARVLKALGLPIPSLPNHKDIAILVLERAMSVADQDSRQEIAHYIGTHGVMTPHIGVVSDRLLTFLVDASDALRP